MHDDLQTFSVHTIPEEPTRVRFIRLPPAPAAEPLADFDESDFAPQFDGSHLVRLWARMREEYIYRPWHQRELATRVDADMPDAIELHHRFMATMSLYKKPEESPFERTFVETDFGRIRVRRTGHQNGAPTLVLLHGGYGDADEVEPVMKLLGDRPMVALDILGCGESDKGGFRDAWVGDYALSVADAIDELGLGTVDLYGIHGGTPVAIETAILLGDRARKLILEGVTMFSEQEAPERIAHLPPFVPKLDGSHLLWAWSFVRNVALWSPPYTNTREAIRRIEPPSVEATHFKAGRVLRAGETYNGLYGAVFAYPCAMRLPELQAEALLCAEAEDTLWHFLDEAGRLAPHGTVVTLPGGLREQVQIYEQFLV